MQHDLRAGVVRSIEILGTGFLTHPQNPALRRKLESTELCAEDYFRQLVRVAYRLLFLFLAEGRGLLHPPEAGSAVRARYDEDLSVRRLRALASTTLGTDDCGLWRSLSRVTTCLGRTDGCADLGLPGLGSFLWSSEATPNLPGPAPEHRGPSVAIRDRDLLDAVRALCDQQQVGDETGEAEDDQTQRGVDFRTVGVGQLGEVYESLLALRPELDVRTGRFSLCPAAGNERKTSGSYYTPDALVRHLLDSALDPVIESRLRQATAEATTTGGPVGPAHEEAILIIRVCDPACGSGHFLVAAAHRLADRLARIRTDGQHPSTDEHRRAFREIVTRCLYGVDLNPMAAEVCRLALWLEAHEPGLPMPVLESRIRVGNALLGATPELLGRGIPDEAFQTLQGDDPAVVRYYRKRNARERRARETRPVVGQSERPAAQGSNHSAPDERVRLVADAWCAAFVWPKHDTDDADALAGCPGEWNAITSGVLDALIRDPDAVQPWIKDRVGRLAAEHRFFHWHLEFPEVFGGPPARDDAPLAARAQDDCEALQPGRGFDVVLGNPPFLNQLETASATEPGLAASIRQRTDGVSRGYADVSATFLLLATRLVRPGGRVALVQPQSLLAAKDAAAVRAEVLSRAALSSLWVSNEHVFPDASVYTCATTLEVGGPRRGPLARSATGRFVPLRPITVDNDALMAEETWAHLTAAASGVPEVTIRSQRVVGDLAVATADFRDQYYGLEGFVIEDADLTPAQRADPGAFPPIVTTGLIDLAECRWGTAPTRLLKRRWNAPRIDRARMEAEGTLGGWLDTRLVPKLLLATQTRIIEIVVDGTGRLVPSVPVITIIPHDPSRMWHLASAIASPVCTAIARQRYAGAALNADAIKLSAKQVLKLPLPEPSRRWDAAAEHMRSASEATDPESRSSALDAMARASVGAFGVPAPEAERLLAWWHSRWSVR
ncbi:MAG: Eco57I restriction-modification methylase domain-containing protein [Phycisphaerales bacterium JB054]